jgi:hypothetical protein
MQKPFSCQKGHSRYKSTFGTERSLAKFLLERGHVTHLEVLEERSLHKVMKILIQLFVDALDSFVVAQCGFYRTSRLIIEMSCLVTQGSWFMINIPCLDKEAPHARADVPGHF